MVGHELRTPITTIRGLAESLAGADMATVHSTIAPALIRNTRRVERLLDDLLMASEVSTALPVDRPERVTVAPAAREVWQRLIAAGTGESARIKIVGDAEALVPPASLRMALERVLDNAIRYGEPPTRIEISALDDAVRIVVDTPGAALHPEEIELALEPFFRGEHAVMTSPGLGLGLAVAHAVMEAAGGHLRVEDRPDGGLITVMEVPAP